ncbi:unnamed protein product, partial [Staurois parvus]
QSAQCSDRRCAVSLGHSRSPIHRKSPRCRLGHVISCVQSQLITDHQSTDDQCALMISVAPAVPPVSVHHCQLSVLISATCQCPSVPHISAYQCTAMPHQCPSELPFSVTHQRQSVPPISAANQCCISVPVSATYQCQSV